MSTIQPFIESLDLPTQILCAGQIDRVTFFKGALVVHV
ncbi:hypothetical protein [Stenotrophomonas phage RAS14]